MRYYNLTIPQQNIWNLQKYYENSSIGNQCGAIFYKEKRDIILLKSAVYQFIKNQSGIRIRFVEKDKPVQYISDKIESIAEMTFESMEKFEAYARKFATEPIGLVERAMYRFVVFQVEGKSGILVVLSHLISDAWTFSLMAKQVDALYLNLCKKTEKVVLQADYVRYIESEKMYLSSERYQKDQQYWKEKYKVEPEKSIVKISSSKIENIKAKRITRRLPLKLAQKFENYCKVTSVTPAVLFETALIIYLAHINLQSDTVTIGIPVLNRKNAKEKEIAGMFVSTMPLTVSVSQEATVRQLIKKITLEHMDIFRHQKYPYSDILGILREKQNFSGNLYDVMISYQNATTDTEAETRWYSNGCSEIPLVIHIDNRDNNNSHTINVDYQVEVFDDEQEIIFILDRLEYVLNQIVDENIEKINDIQIVTRQEQNIIVEKFNDTYLEYSSEKCVHELFMEQVQKTPDRIALVFHEKKFTYRQLDNLSNALAVLLRRRGVKVGDVVPILAKKNWYVIVGILGILKAGGAYMPIDPEYPNERTKYIISNAKSSLICTLEDCEYIENVEIIDLKNIIEKIIEENLECSRVKMYNTVDDLCYVIFTSGSSGQPKGVMITHRNLYNYVMTVQKEYKINRFDMSFITSMYVDLSVTVTFLPILTGGTLELIDGDLLNGLKYIVNKSDSVYKLTPTHVDMMMEMKLKLPKNITFILGGEAIKRKHIAYICESGRLLDEYGPTETTVGCCIKMYEKKSDNYYITIGTPLSNTQIYILDKYGKPLPIGVAGELCIAGFGVGLGYMNQPELTAEKFVHNPFATDINHHGHVMYHTGDLARWRTDGELEYLGRIDTQVKIRGLRIELGEIESVMSEFLGIQLAAVADKRDGEGRQYLVGYYISNRQIDEQELRRYLVSKLPKYMVPNYFVSLKTIPMTASGKTDRKKLPIPDFTIKNNKYVRPVTVNEKKLCNLLEKILHIKKIGITDDFFEYGGDSLTAIGYVAKAHNIGVEFSLQDVFDYPTVEQLCHFIDKGNEKKVQYKISNFEKYHTVFSRNVIDESTIFHKKALGNILLTGATGFLGAHVLDRLMQEESGKIYCLVRSNKNEDVGEKLRERLKYYFGNKYQEDVGIRIIPIIGNIRKEGLSDEMPEDIQTVIHTAATVKHYGSYSFFYSVNVQGTEHVIEYTKRIGAKLVHISTLSVSENNLSNDSAVYQSNKEKCFDETSFYIGQSLDNVYIRSKFEAENKIYNAMLDGLNAIVIRVGNLTNRLSDYKFQPNYEENAFLLRMKAILEFGMFPDYLMNLYVELSPIDKIAEGLVKIVQYAKEQTVFHLYNNHGILFESFIQIVRKLGIPMRVVDGTIFDEKLQRTIVSNKTEYIFEAFQRDMDRQGRLIYDSNIHIKNNFTMWFLKKVGFEWNETDMEYINGYINYFRQIGYLEVSNEK